MGHLAIQHTEYPEQPLKPEHWFGYIHREYLTTEEGPNPVPVELRLTLKKRAQMINLFKNRLKTIKHETTTD